MMDLPFGANDTVTVELPAPHPAILLATDSGPSWTIRWRTPSGTYSEIQGVTEDLDIRLERGRFTPILVIPETAAAGLPDGPFPCAGALYPLHAEDSSRGVRLAASWERGLAAVCADTVLSSANDGYESGYTLASRFNWTRFIRTAAALSDPGALDLPRIVNAILSGSVSVRDIREKSRAEVTVSRTDLMPACDALTAGTAFIPAWPGGAPFIWPDADTATISAPEGFSRYFSASGFLAVEVRNGVPSCVFFGGYGLQD